MSFGGNGSGGSSISGSSDVVLSNPLNSQVLTYDDTTDKWTNAAPSGSVTPDIGDVNGLQAELDAKIPTGAHWMQVVVLPTEGSALPGNLNPDYPALIFVQAS